MAKRKVGVVGLGIMGGAFARNLVAAGWEVTGYDIDQTRRRAMATPGSVARFRARRAERPCASRRATSSGDETLRVRRL